MTDARNLPMADKAQTQKYMDAAVDFVTKETGISQDVMTTLLSKANVATALEIGQFTIYMAVYACAERAAQADGLTLRDWKKADAVYALMDQGKSAQEAIDELSTPSNATKH